MNKTFYSNGKLLLTGEYVVLDGALSLAVPTTFGQSLAVKPIDKPKLIWKSIDNKRKIWFEDTFLFDEITSGSSNPRNDISKRLFKILTTAKQLNPNFLNSDVGYNITTQLDFSQFWGLGSSSTLINNIANWANIDAYKLLELTFGGSGYDIACAQHNTAIIYQLNKPFDCAQGDSTSIKKTVNEVEFNPSFKDHLYFVHLNKKQNSREGIAHYNATKQNTSLAISEISDITSKIINCNFLNDFETLLTSHEHIISKIIRQKPIKNLLFSHFNGSIKSLGAWGGDFILVASKENPTSYFKKKGFETIISYSEMVLNQK